MSLTNRRTWMTLRELLIGKCGASDTQSVYVRSHFV